MNVTLLIREIHVILAVLWAGGAVLLAFIIGPTMAANPQAAGPFMAAQMRRGGFGTYFMVVGTLTVLTGGYTYGALHYGDAPFGSGAAIMVTIGAILAVLALIEGFALLLPNEMKIKKLVKSMPAGGPPPPEMMKQMQELGARQGKLSAMSTLIVVAVLLLMTLRVVFY